MLTRLIPRTGEPLPAVGVGTWQAFDVAPNAPERAELRSVLTCLTECGGRLIDSSPMYGQAESVVGDLTAELGNAGPFFVATKVWTRGEAEGERQMRRSLERLRVERLDLMQIHNLLDVETHTATLLDWKAQGRIRYVGITHYHAGAHADVERLVKTGCYDFVQINYSMSETGAERSLLPACMDAGVAVIANRPYGGGALFRASNGRRLPAWADELGCNSWGQFFLKWILGHPAITCVIPGTRRAAHLRDNARAAAGNGPEESCGTSGSIPDGPMRKRMTEYLNA